MEYADIKLEKEELEQGIFQLISAFEGRTGFAVTSVRTNAVSFSTFESKSQNKKTTSASVVVEI
jgi:hypothetical protein